MMRRPFERVPAGSAITTDLPSAASVVTLTALFQVMRSSVKI